LNPSATVVLNALNEGLIIFEFASVFSALAFWLALKRQGYLVDYQIADHPRTVMVK
jgi:hypothetical protein